MCGICGILNKESADPVDRELLAQMNASMHHRGPDSTGSYTEGNCGLAMCRLAVIDVAGGSQPIFNEERSIALVFNGEIYNFRALRAELEQHGHHFRTSSDTEVIVHAYEQWGDDAMRHFNGMFVFALWDERRDRLLLARDRMGKKPLYWHSSPRGVVWASEAKALLAVPWVSRRVNPRALHHYLTLQYTPDPLTIFEDIHQLPAAHKLVVERGREPQLTRWWQLRFDPKWGLPQAEVLMQARELLGRAVKRRLISEVPLGAFLSGGLDSSCIVALMAERMSQPVKTFSIGFEERHFSETHYASQVAERYRTEHHEFLFRPQNLVQLIEDVIAATDEPFADPSALPLYELARQAGQHVTVALCGDGGDETLGGYRRYALDRLLSFYAALPSWLTQRLVPATAALLPEPTWVPLDRNPIGGLRRLGRFSRITPKASIVRWGSYFAHQEKLDLYADRWRDEFKKVHTAEWIAAAYDDAMASGPLDRTLGADHATYLAGDLLPKTDRTTMAHSVEARAPFLDSDWVEWTARLPTRYKIRWLETKWLLKAAFAEKLPVAVAKRGKQGFSVPVGLWLQDDLQKWAQERLFENQALDEWFRPTAIRRLLEEHTKRRFDHGKRLWALLMFSSWMERYG